MTLTTQVAPTLRGGSLLVLIGCLAVCGCYDGNEVRSFLQEPRSPVSGIEYRVLPPDTLKITSRHVPEINNIIQQVRPDGKINLPLLGEIEVAGRTPKEVEAGINQAAKKYYGEVDSNVQIVEYNSQKFYVFGQVARPGPLPWTGHDTLLDALARVQPTILAWPEQIIVVRGGDPNEGGFVPDDPSDEYKRSGVHPPDEEHPRHKMTINLMAMIKSGDMANNVLLLPNDVIFVKPNPLAGVGLAIQTLLFPIRPAAESVRLPAGASAAMGG